MANNENGDPARLLRPEVRHYKVRRLDASGLSYVDAKGDGLPMRRCPHAAWMRNIGRGR